MVRARHRGFALGALILYAILIPSALSAQTFKTLAQARQAAAGAKTQDSLHAIILAAIPQLSVRDSIALCQEFEPKAGSTLKAELRGTLGSMYLLLGQTAEAAAWYAKAATLDPRFSAEAARLALAIGDVQTVDTLMKGDGISKETQTLLEVWGLLLDGKYAVAGTRAKEALASFPDGQTRSELLFLQYVADFGRYGAVQSNIAQEYSSSMGADLIAGRVFPSSSFLLLLGIPWLGSAAPLEDYQSTNAPNEAAAPSSPSQWLQVGYFSSKENADRLSKSLSSKHFEARIVEMKNKDGEIRWLVQVAAKDDWQKTQSALKDLGYESYLASP